MVRFISKFAARSRCAGLGRVLRALTPVFALVAVLGFAEAASATVTLPSTGIAMEEYVAAGILALGATAAAAIGGYVAYAIVIRSVRWLGVAMGGK